MPRNVIIDIDGVVRYSAIGYNETAITAVLDELLDVVVDIDGDNQPRSHKLLSNYPNPFNAGTRITFQLRLAGVTILTIYDGRGQKVRTLLEQDLEIGEYTISWDTLNEQGDDLPSGIYFAKLQSGSTQESQKLLLLK